MSADDDDPLREVAIEYRVWEILRRRKLGTEGRERFEDALADAGADADLDEGEIEAEAETRAAGLTR